MVKYRKIVMIIQIVHMSVLFDTIRILLHRCTLKEISVYSILGTFRKPTRTLDRGR